MALPPSGTITIGDVSVELGKGSTVQASLNDADIRALAGIPSGPISLADLYGKSSEASLVLPNLNLGEFGGMSQYDPPPDFRFHQNGSFEFNEGYEKPLGQPSSPVAWLSDAIELGRSVFIRLRADKTLNWSRIRYRTSAGYEVDLFIPRDIWTEISFYPHTDDYIQVYASSSHVAYDGLDQNLDISLDGGATFSTVFYRNWYE